MTRRPGGRETVDQSTQWFAQPEAPPATPGVVLFFSEQGGLLHAAPLLEDGIVLGRDEGPLALEDEAASREHARVRFDGEGWILRDLGSRNGTFIDGAPVIGEIAVETPRVLRIGRSLFLLTRDIQPFLDPEPILRDETVVGPTLQVTWRAIARAAQHGDALLLTGESGAGKELAAKHFHLSGPNAAGPFVAVNCAAIPEGLAERLLFGARRGAYSGAVADADGYAASADGGSLFLDEVGELDPGVQAKLLRLLEAREVTALGAARPRPVNLRVCCATNLDLRAAMASGDFREDLFFRIARPEVRLPPLRERTEDLPWLIASAIERVDKKLLAHVSLVEACALRTWPGNVRELLSEVREAALETVAGGRTVVRATELRPQAGAALDRAADAKGGLPTREEIERVLREEDGNVTRAAKALGIHRNQLRRFLAKNQIDPQRLVSGN